MSERSASWRPGQTVCRCCLAEGCYKDISTEYFWMGKREVYADMLLDTFDVNISFSQAGGPGSSSRLICEPCISRLRDASEFKRQVLECEKAFVQQLEPGSSAIDVDDGAITLTGSEIKVEAIKLEKSLSDDEDFHDAPNFDDDDDDLDDQPLTTFASRVPKKESVDILELLDTEKTPEKRKMPVRAKATPAKKLKAAPKTVVAKAATSKTATKTGKVDTKKKEYSDISVAKWNAEIIIKFTTSYPFRIPGDYVQCVYCDESFENPNDFRTHMSSNTHKYDRRVALRHSSCDNFLKLDCTELKCKICNESYDKLDEIALHLKAEHRARLNLEKPLELFPYKIFRDKFQCGICDEKQPGLRQLGRHIVVHFQKYTCETCGKCYINSSTLKKHVSVCSSGKKYCQKCRKLFDTPEERRRHLDANEKCWPYKCDECYLKFPTWRVKQKHMLETHQKAKNYPCMECGAVFYKNYDYRRHYNVVHSAGRFRCTFCERDWPSEQSLKRHIITHTKEKPFQCDACPKAFGTKTLLRQHYWMHREKKRFECKICDKKFNQRVSWRTHMKGHHPEIYRENPNAQFPVI